jgi:hypothetical protein
MTDNQMTVIRRLLSVFWDLVCIVLSAVAVNNNLWAIFLIENSSIQQKFEELIQSIFIFPKIFFPLSLMGAILCFVGATVHIILFLNKRTYLANKFRSLQNWGAAIAVLSSVVYIAIAVRP